jgi:hypothetical protein
MWASTMWGIEPSDPVGRGNTPLPHPHRAPAQNFMGDVLDDMRDHTTFPYQHGL